MISKEKLKEYAKIKNYHLGQAEIDYIQDIILFVLYQEFGKELIFKGGTALTKCYGFDRFSEDLDFTAMMKKEFNKIIGKGLERYYLEYEEKTKETRESIEINYKIKGPLYTGSPLSTCKIQIDISLREKVELEPVLKRIGLHIEEIPMFDVPVMDEKEILAEKIRAIMTRNKARDLYDAYYLLKKGVTASKELINNKLRYYNKIYTKKELEEAVQKKKNIWQTELKYLTKNTPLFEDVKKEVLAKV